MPDTHLKTELKTQLETIGRTIAETVEAIPPGRFEVGTAESWSAAEYLKHLILSVKPLAKAMTLPPAQLEAMFGRAAAPSRTFQGVVELYEARLAEGVRAEDNAPVMPTGYRMPEGVSNVQTYLLETWNDAMNRLLTALENYEDADLDVYQLPHPAIGVITLREMLFFTLHHNTMHWHDIRRMGLD